jgi:Ca2+-binding EF-hand superfamily protein
MISGIKGYSESMQYIYRVTRKASVEVDLGSEDSQTLGSLPQSGAFFWNQVFNKIDRDSNSIISKEELETYISQLEQEVDPAVEGESESTGSAVTEAAQTQYDINRALLNLFQIAGSADPDKRPVETQTVDISGSQARDAQADRIFTVIDSDRDGRVSESEFADAKAMILKRVQNTMESLQLELTEAFMNMLETSGSIGGRGGVMTRQTAPSVAQTGSGEAKGMLKKIDANLDGEVSRDELQKALSKTREKIDRNEEEDR